MCHKVFIMIVLVQSYLALAKDGQNERSTRCGKVPPNGDMIKVVKPMATLVTHILPIMEHNNVTMYQLFEIFEESCASFETCYPGGFINDKTIKGPGGQCLLKAIMEGTTMKDRTRATNIVQGLIESLPAKRKWFYAGMHWLVAMAKVD